MSTYLFKSGLSFFNEIENLRIRTHNLEFLPEELYLALLFPKMLTAVEFELANLQSWGETLLLKLLNYAWSWKQINCSIIS